VQHEFDRLLREERFNGGTDITRAMLDAADYMRREGRRDARRAIVILTDDQTEFDRDDEGVGRALARADAVMCALIAPDAGQYGGNRGGGQRPEDGAAGGGLGGGLGGIIFGPRGGGNRYPGGGGMGGSHTKSAGTAEIARDSGGDSMSVNDASALEDTLARASPALHAVFQSSRRCAARPGTQYRGGSHPGSAEAFFRRRSPVPPDRPSLPRPPSRGAQAHRFSALPRSAARTSNCYAS
jgi:hypothetical protein